jgi:hypothetical protein
MTYTYCTLATGQSYLDIALNFANDLNCVSNNHKMIIATDIPHDNSIKNTDIVTITEKYPLRVANAYNYNLKYFPIQAAAQTNTDAVIFIDADWRMHKGYTEEKINSLIQWLYESPYDFVYERPHTIGASKRYLPECFWRHKIEPYNLMNTDIYDDVDVCNEQFLLFRNNEKLKIFADKWEERCKYACEHNI